MENVLDKARNCAAVCRRVSRGGQRVLLTLVAMALCAGVVTRNATDHPSGGARVPDSGVVFAGDAVKPSGSKSSASKQNSSNASQAEQTPEKKLFTGKVVNLQQALKERGIEARDEFADQVVLQTSDGELIPIVPDWRGRAFYQDERLRNRNVELVGYRRKGVPYLQVLMVFTFDEKGRRMYTDYWCDICSIPMYELKRCECCQGPIRLRFQPRDLPDYITKQESTQARKSR